MLCTVSCKLSGDNSLCGVNLISLLISDYAKPDWRESFGDLTAVKNIDRDVFFGAKFQRSYVEPGR